MTNAELKLRHRRFRCRVAQRRYRQKKAAEFRVLGLSLGRKNWGQPIKHTRHDLWELHGAKRKTAVQQIYREQHVQSGLTTRGTPRKHHLHHLGKMSRRAQARARYQFYYKRKIELGLTFRGTPRKHAIAPSALELKWREFRNTIQIPEDRDWTDYGMSFAAREKAMEREAA